jgi:hypothetical protein
MKQYEFEIHDKRTGRVEYARATARTPDIARAQIVLAYGAQFDVMNLFRDVNPPHHIVGEIDCSDFPMSDMAWLMRQAAAIEGITV